METVSPPPVSFSDRESFELVAEALDLTVAGVDVSISDFSITGRFDSTHDAMIDMEVTGLLDTRPLDPILGGDPGAVCGLVVAFGISCIECPDGAESCLAVEVTDLRADLIPDLTVVPVTDEG